MQQAELLAPLAETRLRFGQEETLDGALARAGNPAEPQASVGSPGIPEF